MLIELISNYICAFLLFNKIEDVRTIVGVYVIAFHHLNQRVYLNIVIL